MPDEESLTIPVKVLTDFLRGIGRCVAQRAGLTGTELDQESGAYALAAVEVLQVCIPHLPTRGGGLATEVLSGSLVDQAFAFVPAEVLTHVCSVCGRTVPLISYATPGAERLAGKLQTEIAETVDFIRHGPRRGESAGE